MNNIGNIVWLHVNVTRARREEPEYSELAADSDRLSLDESVARVLDLLRQRGIVS